MSFINFKQVKEIFIKAKSIELENKNIFINIKFKQTLLDSGSNFSLYHKDSEACFTLIKDDSFFHYRSLIIVSNEVTHYNYLPWVIRYE